MTKHDAWTLKKKKYFFLWKVEMKKQKENNPMDFFQTTYKQQLKLKSVSRIKLGKNYDNREIVGSNFSKVNYLLS
jgi:hypothetical protein